MAALPPSLQPTMTESIQREPSIRSVASNSSIASGVSLTRRPRTRARSRTVTGASSRPENISSTSDSELPYIDKPFVQEPDEIPSFLTSLDIPPIRPSRSPQRQESVELPSAGTPSSRDLELATAEVTFVEPIPSSLMIGKKSKTAKIASNLPVIETVYKNPPSAFSRDPALTPVINVRDSVSTQQSGTSSSLYPPSTSTASAPESPPSPRSMSEQFDQLDVPTFGPEVNELQEYDGDDVAYRLRLLVKNNYFLPPAHSKPSPSDLASSQANASKKQTKSSTPAFLDLFRVGKPKSKPTTPTASPNFDPTLPMLRTTSDSITVSYALRSQQPRSSSQLPRTSPQPAPRGRVVVVREKMNDIAVAAKQAEQDLKNRGVRLDQNSQKAKQEIFDNVIDPTDAVDLLPPSASYPFAVQASALHGLGVQESLGAAVLADRLPPPKSPNMSSSYDADEDWRKALLHEAVHHSLDTTPDVSSFSHIIGTSTPLGSPRPNVKLTSRAPSPQSRGDMGRKILDQSAINLIDSSEPNHSREQSSQSQPSSSKSPSSSLRVSMTRELQDIHDRHSANYLPLRVDTPCEPLTPLAPPPRRHFVNPLYSLSQTDLTSNAHVVEPQRSASLSSRRTLRKSASSPMLSDHESVYRNGFVMTPPPMPSPLSNSRVSSQVTASSFETVRDHLDESMSMSESQYSDDESEAGIPRSSIALSALNGRPSLSEYSQSSMSPTTSDFQNALNHGVYYSASSSGHLPPHLSFEYRPIPAESVVLRNSAMSPPPRMSSSLAHVALPPPPRSASFQYPRQFLRPSSVASSTEPGSPIVHAVTSRLQFGEPEPTTPPLPLVERRGNPNQISLSLDIPRHTVPAAIHSAPGPSSPTSFFDSIQTQPNAMDDLESSSDESEDEVEENTPPPQTTLFVDPRTRVISSISATSPPRPPIMKLGNHSTPYVGRPTESFRQTLLPIGGASSSSKKPVANIPTRAPFFTDRKSDSGHTVPSSTYDFYKYAQENPPANANALTATNGARRLSATEQVALWRNNQRAQESLRKLDGMLIQHMEAEKDTIKRIATTMKQTNTTTTPSIPS